MLVYRSATRRASLRSLTHEVTALVASTTDGCAGGDAWTDLLIACGELESAVTDAISPTEDESAPLATALNDLTIAAAGAAVAAWSGEDAGPEREGVERALEAVRTASSSVELPVQLEVGVPEGFAYYGLYPQTYAASARELLEVNDAQRIVCIGIRSIGATLGAVVTAVLRRAGRRVSSCTVRPRGHPFDRTLSLAPMLHAALRREAADGALFVVVDEGPGLSGSSFASVADAVGSMGVPDDRIVFFPSWVPASDALRSSRGRERWERHPKLCTPFEQLFETPGALLDIARELCGSPVRVENVSGGWWRHVVYNDERDWPPAQPQHERRKYLVRDANGVAVALLKFAGLGRHGRATVDRARTLASAGFAPRVLGARNGFVATEWIVGQPAVEGEADAALLDAVARHVARLAATARGDGRVPFDELLDIARVNASEALGETFASGLTNALERFRALVQDVRVCRVDGRMLPHEWIGSASGWRKVDGVDHHDDHFLPGDQDPAWDIAGAIVELLLDARQARSLVDAYARHSGDDGVAARLPFHHAVYLATRLGYVTLSAEALGDEPDSARLRALARRYAAMLRRAAVTLGAVDALPLPDEWRDIRAIAFDADDTLRRTTVTGAPCPHAPDEWRLLPWVATGTLTRLPWGKSLALGVASNQDHVGYGHLSERQARALLRSMAVEATGVVPDREAVRFCPHVLEVECRCRKPRDGMLRALIAHFDVPLDALLFVGDAATDAEAARRSGARFVHVDQFARALAAASTVPTPTSFVTASAA